MFAGGQILINQPYQKLHTGIGFWLNGYIELVILHVLPKILISLARNPF